MYFPYHTLFSNAVDLQRKPEVFQTDYKQNRFYVSLEGDTLKQISCESKTRQANLESDTRQLRCHGLVQVPMVAYL